MLNRVTRDKYLAARLAGVAAASIGLAVLLGWLFDLDLLKRFWPDGIAMKANTALAVAAAGVGLVALARVTPRRQERLLAKVAGAFCVVLSALTLVEYFWRNLGIDQLLFHDATRTAAPGRPAPHTAVAFVFVGANLIALARSRESHPRWTAWSNNALAIVVASAIIGDAYSVNYLRGFSSVNGIAVHTLAALVILVAGCAALEPRSTWLAVFISPGAGGRMARRFAPLVLLSPILIGIQTAIYDHPTGHAVAAVVTTAAIVITLLTGASALDRAEAQRQTLGGLLPICSHCKRIRDDAGYWSQVEAYVSKHSEAEFSHSLCPTCLIEYYPEHAAEIIAGLEQSDPSGDGEEAI